MRRPAYLILHGYQASGPGHWQTWVAARLRAGEAIVAYPDFPDADLPQLASWLDVLRGELDALPEPPVVLCHSLACLLWLHHVAARRRAGGARAAGRAAVAGGRAGRARRTSSRRRCRRSAGRAARVLATTTRTAPRGRRSSTGGRSACRSTCSPGRGHLNPEAGLGPWPAVEAWARDGAAPVTA